MGRGLEHIRVVSCLLAFQGKVLPSGCSIASAEPAAESAAKPAAEPASPAPASTEPTAPESDAAAA